MEKLPPETEDKIIEVSLRHVLLAFGGIIIGSITVGVSIAFVRDYTKYRRQKAIIDAAKQLLLTLKDGGQNSLSWKNAKTESSSPMKTSKKSKNISDTSV